MTSILPFTLLNSTHPPAATILLDSSINNKQEFFTNILNNSKLVSSVYIWSRNVSHSANDKSEAKVAGIIAYYTCEDRKQFSYYFA